MLNKFVIVLPFLFAFYLSAGCEEEKPKPAADVKKKQKVMTGSTELYASDEEKITFNKNDISLTENDIRLIKKRNFGISRVIVDRKSIEVSFDPSLLTADSVKKIFSEFITL